MTRRAWVLIAYQQVSFLPPFGYNTRSLPHYSCRFCSMPAQVQSWPAEERRRWLWRRTFWTILSIHKIIFVMLSELFLLWWLMIQVTRTWEFNALLYPSTRLIDALVVGRFTYSDWRSCTYNCKKDRHYHILAYMVPIKYVLSYLLGWDRGRKWEYLVNNRGDTRRPVGIYSTAIKLFGISLQAYARWKYAECFMAADWEKRISFPSLGGTQGTWTWW